MQRSVLEQYKYATNEGKYKLLSQKLAQHLQNQAQDPNTHVRWIWQLIQNAKDVPNKFEKVKMKIQINQRSLKFSHNGDPFRPQDLSSLIFQYSSKQDKVQQDSTTTGKYGTGFITTYIVSRKLRIKGIIQSSKKGYQRFQISLNRTYANRDKDFPQRLAKEQQDVEEVLRSGKMEKHLNRTQNDLDTSFSYEDLDNAALEIINKGLASLKAFHYSILFNPKIYSIQIKDLRKGYESNQFMIIRDKQKKIGQVNIFKCLFKVQNGTFPFELAYRENKLSYATVVVPVQTQGNNITIQRIDDIPKVFKQFPLVGVPDIGFNYAFTSGKFFPNQSRSNLLLKQIEGRVIDKVKYNVQIIQTIFAQAKNLIQDLSNLNTKNMYYFLMHNTAPFLNAKQQVLNQEYIKYLSFLNNLRIVPIEDEYRAKLKDAILIYEKTDNQQSHVFSSKLTLMFRPYFPANKMPTAQSYYEIYPFVMQDLVKTLINIIGINQCLTQLSNGGYQGLCMKIGQQKDPLDFLEELYELLNQQKKIYVTNNRDYHIIPIILTQKLVFAKPSQLSGYRVPTSKFYLDLENFLNMDLDKVSIHQDMSQYFIGFNQINSNTITSLAEDYFQMKRRYKQQDKYEFSLSKLKKMFILLKAIGRYPQLINIVSKFQQFSHLQQLNISKQGVDNWDTSNLYVSKFKFYISKYFNKLISKQCNYQLKVLIENLTINSQDQAIKWFNMFIKEVQSSNNKNKKQKDISDIIFIPYNLCWDTKFRQHSLCTRINVYPTQTDIDFYYKYRNWKMQVKEYSRVQQYQVQKIQQLIHPKIQKISKLTRMVNYSTYFKASNTFYHNFQEKQKYQVLLYIQKLKLNDPDQEKLKVFENIIPKRVKDYIDLRKVSQEKQDTIYTIMTLEDPDVKQLGLLLKKFSVKEIKEKIKFK